MSDLTYRLALRTFRAEPVKKTTLYNEQWTVLFSDNGRVSTGGVGEGSDSTGFGAWRRRRMTRKVMRRISSRGGEQNPESAAIPCLRSTFWAFSQSRKCSVNIVNKLCLGPWPVSSWKVEINPALRCWDVTNLAWGRPLSFLSLTILTLSSPRKQKWPKQPSAFHLWKHFFPFWFSQQSG